MRRWSSLSTFQSKNKKKKTKKKQKEKHHPTNKLAIHLCFWPLFCTGLETNTLAGSYGQQILTICLLPICLHFRKIFSFSMLARSTLPVSHIEN